MRCEPGGRGALVGLVDEQDVVDDLSHREQVADDDDPRVLGHAVTQDGEGVAQAGVVQRAEAFVQEQAFQLVVAGVVEFDEVWKVSPPERVSGSRA